MISLCYSNNYIFNKRRLWSDFPAQQTPKTKRNAPNVPNPLRTPTHRPVVGQVTQRISRLRSPTTHFSTACTPVTTGPKILLPDSWWDVAEFNRRFVDDWEVSSMACCRIVEKSVFDAVQFSWWHAEYSRAEMTFSGFSTRLFWFPYDPQFE